MGDWTPGPWKVVGRDITALEGELICCVTDSYDRAKAARDRDAADRRLIAAAPCMYEALETIVSTLSDAFPALSQMDQLRKARAALAKARGETANQGDKV